MRPFLEMFPDLGPAPTARMAETLDAITCAFHALGGPAQVGDPILTRMVASSLGVDEGEALVLIRVADDWMQARDAELRRDESCYLADELLAAAFTKAEHAETFRAVLSLVEAYPDMAESELPSLLASEMGIAVEEARHRIDALRAWTLENTEGP